MTAMGRAEGAVVVSRRLERAQRVAAAASRPAACTPVTGWRSSPPGPRPPSPVALGALRTGIVPVVLNPDLLAARAALAPRRCRSGARRRRRRPGSRALLAGAPKPSSRRAPLGRPDALHDGHDRHAEGRVVAAARRATTPRRCSPRSATSGASRPTTCTSCSRRCTTRRRCASRRARCSPGARVRAHRPVRRRARRRRDRASTGRPRRSSCPPTCSACSRTTRPPTARLVPARRARRGALSRRR